MSGNIQCVNFDTYPCNTFAIAERNIADKAIPCSSETCLYFYPFLYPFLYYPYYPYFPYPPCYYPYGYYGYYGYY